MIRDPSYREIEARLSGKSDPELFEECAGDLLRTVHPTLVPIRGGDDAGMDGAIADAGGLPFGAAENMVLRPGAHLGAVRSDVDTLLGEHLKPAIDGHVKTGHHESERLRR